MGENNEAQLDSLKYQKDIQEDFLRGVLAPKRDMGCVLLVPLLRGEDGTMNRVKPTYLGRVCRKMATFKDDISDNTSVFLKT